MKSTWTKIGEDLPIPYKTVLISKDNGETYKRAYRIYSEKEGNLWVDADENNKTYYLSDYRKWKYESKLD